MEKKMNRKTLPLGGAATLALLLTVPALAQTSPGVAPPPGTSAQDGGLYGSQVNPPQVSSPAEKQETRQLNAQAVDGTAQPPAALNGEAPVTNPPVPDSAPQSAAPRDVETAQIGSQQQYQQQQTQYEQQQEQYRDEQRHYEHNLRRFDEARWAYDDYPAAYAYRFDDSPQRMRLYLIAEPSQQLANAPVEGPGGNWVGRIRNIETGFDGRPTRVQIALNHRVFVWVAADNLRFDPDDHVAFTRLTRDALWDSPDAEVEAAASY
jgi:hypothetical protein